MITLDLSILNQKGTPMFYSDTLALRPNFGIAGRIFIDTASPYGIYRDTGSAWVQIADVSGGGGVITGTGTATQIAYFTSASAIASSANLFWDNTNSRLGVNTNTPSSTLDIHSAVQSVIQANNTTLGNSFLSFQLQGTGKWQIGNVYNAGANYFRIQDQLNSLERFTIQNTGEIDFLGYSTTLNTLTGITGTTPSALTNSGFTNDFTFNSGISTSASVNAIGLLVDNGLNYSGANTINATSYNASGLFRIGLTFGSAAASITYTQGSTGQIRTLTSNQVQYIQNGNNSGTISHYANIQILGDNKSGSGLTTFTNRYGLLINDFADFAAGNTYTNRWAIYQQGLNENNFFAGKVGIGSGYTPSTLQLDVIGTARITGDTSIVGNITVPRAAGTSAIGIFSQASRSALYIGSMQGTNAVDSLLVFGADSTSTPFVIKGGVSSNLTGGTEYFRATINGISVNNTNPFFDTNYKGINIAGGSAGSEIYLGKSDGTRIGAIAASSASNSLSIYTVFAGDTIIGSNSQFNLTNFNATGNIQIQNGGTFIDIASAIFSINSTTKGFLPPRMTTAQKTSIATPSAGLIVFDTTLNKLCVYTTAWETITSV